MCSVNTYSGVTGQSWVSHVGHGFFFFGGGKGPIYIDNNYPKIITYKNYQSWASHVGSLRYTHRLTEIVSVALLLVGCLLGGRIRLMRLR